MSVTDSASQCIQSVMTLYLDQLSFYNFYDYSLIDLIMVKVCYAHAHVSIQDTNQVGHTYNLRQYSVSRCEVNLGEIREFPHHVSRAGFKF